MRTTTGRKSTRRKKWRKKKNKYYFCCPFSNPIRERSQRRCRDATLNARAGRGYHDPLCLRHHLKGSSDGIEASSPQAAQACPPHQKAAPRCSVKLPFDFSAYSAAACKREEVSKNRRNNGLATPIRRRGFRCSHGRFAASRTWPHHRRRRFRCSHGRFAASRTWPHHGSPLPGEGLLRPARPLESLDKSESESETTTCVCWSSSSASRAIQESASLGSGSAVSAPQG
jgi:hypothetical protein